MGGNTLMTKPTLLIDGDIVVYQNCCSVEEKFPEWDQRFSDFPKLQAKIKKMVDSFIHDLKSDDIRMVLTDRTETNFRKDISPTYKENRKDLEKPLFLTEAQDWVTDEYDAITIPKLEADDVIGLMMTTDSKKMSKDKIIISIDKDFKSIPGANIYNFRKNEFMAKNIEPIEADRFWMAQTLIGDPVDGYYGAPGIGKVKAEKALADCKTLEEMWVEVVYLFKTKDMTEEDALVNARMARILRNGDYNYKKGKVKLWQPPEVTHKQVENTEASSKKKSQKNSKKKK
jgi:5'-3' exonuclease